MSDTQSANISRVDFDAFIFDLDGVITDTATTHRRAWKEVFDEFMERHQEGEFRPFSDDDYRRYVDGKPRFDGVRSFLFSRGIDLEEGTNTDEPGFTSVYGLGMEKNKRYQKRLAKGEIDVLQDSLDFLKKVKRAGFSTALVSSSQNAALVLDTLGIADYFEVRVDGVTLVEQDMAGKPAPDMFLEAAIGLDVAPKRAVVIEDAESGVQAGRAGGFGLVIGLAKGADERRELKEHGADLAVETLAAVDVEEIASQ